MRGQILDGQILPLGRLLITPGAIAAFTEAEDKPITYLARHARGDWGCVGAEDRAANDRDVLDGNRILSAHILRKTGLKVWIITEADRSATTILLPEEY
ncbi:MAG: hypothetical protein ACYC08_04410 [Armatimonadota bacterium]